MGLKSAAQAIIKADELKGKILNSKDLLHDNEAWTCQRQLQRIYQQVLILDLEYALDKKVEQDLWNFGFKNYIGTLQELTKDKKNPKRSECQALLSWCLDAASGFYLTLLQGICSAFDLDLPFRRNFGVYGGLGKVRDTENEVSSENKDNENQVHEKRPSKSSCLYVSQHCLVHLGDVARYRGQARQAEAFYRHAVHVAPCSGQPYNQLALLEGSRCVGSGDRLSIVFYYVRSICTAHPFPAGRTNLERTLKASLQRNNVDAPAYNSLEELSSLGAHASPSEFISCFLRLHALLLYSSDINANVSRDSEAAWELCWSLGKGMTAHVATQAFNSWKLVQMLSINLFTLIEGGVQDSAAWKKQIVYDLMAGSLSAYLLPVYTLSPDGDNDTDALLRYFALPAIKLILEWIILDHKVLEELAFTSRLQIWPSLSRLLNGLKRVLSSFDALPYAHIPLPEDIDLQGFLPLHMAFSDLQFHSRESLPDEGVYLLLRGYRLVDLGQRLAIGPAKSHLRLRSVNDKEVFEVAPGAFNRSTPPPQPVAVHTSKPHGILKPRGSLEKARVEKGDSGKKAGRQNVAMQAILRKQSGDEVRTSEPKQVTFKTPSPSLSPPEARMTEQEHGAWQPNLQSNLSLLPHGGEIPYPMTSGTENTWPPSEAPILSEQGLPLPPLGWWQQHHQQQIQQQQIQKQQQKLHQVHHQQMPQISQLPRRVVTSEVEQSANAMGNLFQHADPNIMTLNPHTISNSTVRPADHISAGWGGTDISSLTHLIGRLQAGRRPPSPPTVSSLSAHSIFQDRGTRQGNLNPADTGTYSLFSARTVHPRGSEGSFGALGSSTIHPTGLQSLWSGPGPSPLERLLEQQKQQRSEGGSFLGPRGGT